MSAGNPQDPKKQGRGSIHGKIDELYRWIQDNPKQTVFYITNAGIFVAPFVVTVPALGVLGLSSGGPVSGKSSINCVSSRGLIWHSNGGLCLHESGWNSRSRELACNSAKRQYGRLWRVCSKHGGTGWGFGVFGGCIPHPEAP
jgi:hypothetical protein